MRSKELSVGLRDRIVPRHRSWEGYQIISAALMVPKNTVAAIILKWKKFGTTKTLPRAGHPARTIGGEGPWSGRLSLIELQSSSVEMREPSRRTTISATLDKPIW
jgi:hypothetical protein